MPALLVTGIDYGAGALASVIMFILIISVYLNDDLTKPENKYFLGSCYSMLAVFVFDFIPDAISYIGRGSALYKISIAVSGVAPNVFVVFFTYYVMSILRKRGFINKAVGPFMIFAAGTSCIFWITDVLMNAGWFVRIINIKNYVYTDNYWLVVVIPVLIMVFDVFIVCSFYQDIKVRELISWLLYAVLPVIAVFFVDLFEITIVYVAEAVALFVVYAFEHNAREKDMALTEKELTDSKLQLMVSQIQPHFMYNSLNSIYYLIEQDPEEAQEAVSSFSDYLRQNINSLKSDKPVLFKEELDHTEAYIYLEKIRFGDRLKIEKDIQCDAFEIPALTLQPLVENAIKHGISSRKEGGTVKIVSRTENRQIIVEVIDDGVGLEASKAQAVSGKSTHIGIQNVNNRLERMCGGYLSVEPNSTGGTISRITMPMQKIAEVKQ